MTDAAGARFWAGLGPGRRLELDRLPGWPARLEAALDEARRAWEVDWVSRADFAEELGLRLEHDGAAAERWWDHLHAADLYLASACARGIGAAIERFEEIYGEEVRRIARRFERPGLAADDLVQLLRAKLMARPAAVDTSAPEDTLPKIASYTGQGFLQNWVRVTATRTFIDCIRWQVAADETPIANELVALLPETAADPELQLLKREHVAHFKEAFSEAAAELDGPDRLLLKQHFVEHLSIDQIGALYHLHRATAARRLARARELLLERVRLRLARRLGLSPERLAGVLDLVASRLELSVERVLR